MSDFRSAAPGAAVSLAAVGLETGLAGTCAVTASSLDVVGEQNYAIVRDVCDFVEAVKGDLDRADQTSRDLEGMPVPESSEQRDVDDDPDADLSAGDDDGADLAGDRDGSDAGGVWVTDDALLRQFVGPEQPIAGLGDAEFGSLAVVLRNGQVDRSRRAPRQAIRPASVRRCSIICPWCRSTRA